MKWRTFLWYLGQRNYSGLYWSSTERGHVNYESRLELPRLVVGDFDRKKVKRIASQPFQLKARVDGTLLRRVTDYLMATDVGPLVVDVKRAEELLDPEFKMTLELTRRVVEVRGWMYEVACEPEEVVYAKIQFLAGYRREWLFDREVLDELRGVAPREPAQSVRTVLHDAKLLRRAAIAGLMHLLWRQEFRADLTRRLCPATTIEQHP